MDGGPLVQISAFPSLAVLGLREVKIYRFYLSRESMWPLIAGPPNFAGCGHSA